MRDDGNKHRSTPLAPRGGERVRARREAAPRTGEGSRDSSPLIRPSATFSPAGAGEKGVNWDEHLEILHACRLCPNVIGQPVTGAVAGARVMLVGQAPGPHEVEQRRPFAYTAGRRLFSWFESAGVSEDDFRSRVYMAAVIRCFPGKDPKSGGDRVPHQSEIANCGSHLDREIRLLQPALVIAVGTLASAEILGIAQLKDAVGRLHRGERAGCAFDVVVLPHPSGRSTWLNKKENAKLLERSLRLIRGHDAFRATFSGSPGKSSARSKR